MASVTSGTITTSTRIDNNNYYGSASITKIPSDANVTGVSAQCTKTSPYYNYEGVTGLEVHAGTKYNGAWIASNNITPTKSTSATVLNGSFSSFNNAKNITSICVKTTSSYARQAEWKITVTYTPPSISWSSATLSLSRSGTTVTATYGGTATHNNGYTVTYYLYEGSTNLGTFSGTTKTLSNVSVGTHTYKVMASGGTVSAQGGSASITVPAAAITWSDATLTLVQNGTDVTAAMGGTETHNHGTAVTYYLYEGSTQIGTFSNNTLTFTPSVGTHTYKTVASGGGISADGASASITVVPPYKTLKIYNGSEWIECIVYRYDGNSFIEVEPYYYDGTNWSECSHT